ncbi:MAG TPA: pyridoxal 5'-phosphate synthase glutaminase subunit PdxT [bacterium]|nr:pyridoxal 5'-phosphate synthase glutaminase subunit PdxT [bacterium]
MRVGILALQGAVAPHQARLKELGAQGVPVRSPQDLAACQGLILPGGESTTMLKLMAVYALHAPLVEFARSHAVWGVCAGAILMARDVENPAQESLALLDITVRRNAYGRQNESFIAAVTLELPGQALREQEAVFIRAPQITRCGAEVVVLARYGGQPAAVQQGRLLASTFHPELAASPALHAYFLDLCQAQAAAPRQAARS